MQTRTRRLVFGGALLLVLIGGYLAINVFGVQTLFLNTSVDEPPPAILTQATSGSPPPSALPGAATSTAPASAAPAAPADVVPPSAATASTIPPAPTASPPPAGPIVVRTGTFHAVAHAGTGTAIVFQNPDGSYGLRLEQLNVDNGPDLYVYAVAAPDATDDDTVIEAGYTTVGLLKANQGNQNYPLPADFDPLRHQSIVIWCQRFAVNFATAPLQ